MNDHIRLIEAAAEFQTSHNADALARLFAAHGVFEDVPFAAVATGHAEMKRFWTETWTALPDFRMELTSIVVDESRGAAEWIMSATHVGDFQDNPGTGRPFRLRAAAVVEFSLGRVSRWSDYWSLADFRKQVGLDR